MEEKRAKLLTNLKTKTYEKTDPINDYFVIVYVVLQGKIMI